MDGDAFAAPVSYGEASPLAAVHSALTTAVQRDVIDPLNAMRGPRTELRIETIDMPDTRRVYVCLNDEAVHAAWRPLLFKAAQALVDAHAEVTVPEVNRVYMYGPLLTAPRPAIVFVARQREPASLSSALGVRLSVGVLLVVLFVRAIQWLIQQQ